MAPFVRFGRGDFQFSEYDSLNSRQISLVGSGVQHGDLIVAFASNYSTATVDGGNFGSLVVSQVNSPGSATASQGPNNGTGDLCWYRNGFPPVEGGGDSLEGWGFVGSCIWNSSAGNILSVAFSTPPTGQSSGPPHVELVVVADANSGGVLTPTAEEITAYSPGNTIPNTIGDFGQADGLWLAYLSYLGARELPTASYTALDFVTITVTNPGTLSASESITSDNALIDNDIGTAISPSIMTTTVDGDVQLDSPASGVGWLLTDQSDNPPTVSRCFFGGSLSVQVWYDSTFDPFPTTTETGGAGSHAELHIPYKEYARDESQLGLTPLAQHKYFENLKTIEAWADGLRCSGSIDNGDGSTSNLLPTDGKWKERQLHIPHKEKFTSRCVRENYLAIERWANAICPPLHIPYKDWVLMGYSAQEQINLQTIEQWGRQIARCCYSEAVIET